MKHLFCLILTQVPWLFDASIRRNICFDSPMNKAKFSRVVQMCALTRDLELLPHGEETFVGEKGSGLSGGQKVNF